MGELPEHVARNRGYWDSLAHDYVADGRARWGDGEPVWGVFGVPESEVGMLPAALDGRDAIELGCGTGYVSAWLARRGARPVGIDNSEQQLETARAFQREFGIEFPLLHGNAEQVPYPDASFDIAISEYGASIWGAPYAWLPEGARRLRPGGELLFLCNSIFSILCGDDDETIPAGHRLLRPLFGMHRVEWPVADSLEFPLPAGRMMELLGESGFQVEELIEVRPWPDAPPTRAHTSLEGAR